MGRIKLAVRELARHAPFTTLGTITGIIVLVLLEFSQVSQQISNTLFYTLHPVHIVLSALVTTSMYRRYGKGKLWAVILIGYTGSIGIATISDAIIPYLGGTLLHVSMEFEIPFIETSKMPFLGIEKWQIVNAAAVIGIAIGYWKPGTHFLHMGHVLLSTWASLFGFTAFGVADWIALIPFVFLFLFLSVWLPCCLSDIVYPLLWVKEAKERVESIKH